MSTILIRASAGACTLIVVVAVVALHSGGSTLRAEADELDERIDRDAAQRIDLEAEQARRAAEIAAAERALATARAEADRARAVQASLETALAETPPDRPNRELLEAEGTVAVRVIAAMLDAAAVDDGTGAPIGRELIDRVEKELGSIESKRGRTELYDLELALGETLMDRGQAGRAAKQLDLALRRRPPDAPIDAVARMQAMLVDAWRRDGRLRVAGEAIDRTVRDPANAALPPPLRFALIDLQAQVLEEAGRTGDADDARKRQLKLGAELFPDDPTPLHDAALALSGLAQRRGVLDDAERVIRAQLDEETAADSPLAVESRARLAWILLQRGASDEGVAIERELVAAIDAGTLPEDAAASRVVGEFLVFRKIHDRAMTVLASRWEDLWPGGAVVELELTARALAQAAEGRGQRDAATAWSRKAADMRTRRENAEELK